MSTLEELCRNLAADIFIGTGYARFVFSGIDFTEWLLVPWQVEELLEETGEEE